MEQMRRDVYAGATLEVEVTACTNPRDGDVKKAQPKLRFKDDEERRRHLLGRAKRHFVRCVNATFAPGDIYVTLTMDDAHEVHDFAGAREIRGKFRRRLKGIVPEVAMVMVMGRGKTTSRIHFHAIIKGATAAEIERAWVYGAVQAMRPLRAHNYYVDELGRKVDMGADYRGLAGYLFDHWTEEQGGHYYLATRNIRQAEREERKEVKTRYSKRRPPKPPKGYRYISCDVTPYGYMCFYYVREQGETVARERGRW